MKNSKITIIGRGFVGKNLYDLYKDQVVSVYNSGNITKLKEKEHDVIFCAAPSGKKWLANKNEEQDLASALSLVEAVSETKYSKLFLFSTVDVYDHDKNITGENSEFFTNQPYGKNRRILEDRLISSSNKVSIIRLPALFGKHLQKNYIFDLLNDNMVEKIKIKSSFQWYFMDNLRQHIGLISRNDMRLVNLVTEPIETELIINSFFPDKKKMLDRSSIGSFYNVKTQHTNTGYFLNKEAVLKEFEEYIKNARNND